MLLKNLRRSSWLASVLGIFGLMTSSAYATTVTGNASATILQAIAVVENTQLAFGKVAVTASGGSVVISTAGVVSGPAGYTFSGSPAAGNFTATGTASQAVTITFSSGDTLTGPGTAMPLGSFTTDAGGSPSLSAGGTLTFNVGATLTVGASQTGGAYTGTYSVSVNYT